MKVKHTALSGQIYEQEWEPSDSSSLLYFDEAIPGATMRRRTMYSADGRSHVIQYDEFDQFLMDMRLSLAGKLK